MATPEPAPPTPSPIAEAWPPRRVVAVTLVCASVAAAFAAAIALRHVLVCLLVGIVIDTALAPVIAWLTRRGVGRVAATVGVYVGIVAIVIGGIAGGAAPLVEQAMILAESLPEAYRQVRGQLTDIPSDFLQRLVALTPEDIASVDAKSGVGAEAVEAVAGETRWGARVVVFAFWVGAVLLLAFNWTLQKERTIASILLFVPDAKRDGARELAGELQGRVGAFVRGQGLLCLIVGVLSLIAYWLIGLPNALVLALLAGVLELVPYFGPVLSTVPALLVAIGGAPHLVLPVLGVAAAVQFLENNFLVPKIMDNSVGVHPVVTLLALVAFTDLFGIIGMFLAIPLAAMLQVIFDRFVLKGDEAEPSAPDGRDRASRTLYEARELLQDVRRQLRQKDDAPTTESDQVEDSIEAIAVELERQLSVHDTGKADAARAAEEAAVPGRRGASA